MSRLAARLETARHDIAEIAIHGSAERIYLPASDGMLQPGKRHLVSARYKSGKSIGGQVQAVDMVAAGATVAILDRENGADEYGRRLRGIMHARGNDADLWQAVKDRLHYFEYPTLLLSDADEMAAAFGGYDLVIYDSSRAFLSSVSLSEDKSDDYAKFMAALVDPVAHAGAATLIYDNTGYTATNRARGSSAKADLNETIFTLKVIKTPSPTRLGQLQLACTDSRFGQTGNTWTLQLGNGQFGSWEPAEHDQTPEAFRPTNLMEKVSRALEATPGLNKRGIRGIPGNNAALDLALTALIAENHVEARTNGQATQHYSLKPYREADDHRAHRAQTVPKRAHGHGAGTVPTVPLPKGTGTGHGQTGTPNNHHRAQDNPQERAEAILARHQEEAAA